MRRDPPDALVFALVVAVVVSAVAVPASALGAPAVTTSGDGAYVGQQTSDGTATANASNDSGSNESLAPGQRLAGVVGVQGAELDGELDQRTLQTRVARADSNASKAAVVATDLNAARERLQTLRETRAELRAAREAGNISRGEYRARMAVTAAQVESLQRQLESNERIARDLPAEALEANGVNSTEIDRLRQNASELTGPEVAEIAREIAGNESARGPANRSETPGRSDARGDAGNGSRASPAANESTRGPPEDAGSRPENASNASRSAPDDRSPTNRSSNGSESGNSGERPADRPTGAEGNATDDETAGNSTTRGAGNGDGAESGSGNGADNGADGNDASGSGDGADDAPGQSDGSNGADGGQSGDSGNADGSGDSAEAPDNSSADGDN